MFLHLTHWPLGDVAVILNHEILKLTSRVNILNISCENALRGMPQYLTLVQVMAWCSQATSHYLSQCWPGSMSPYGVTRPQWVNHVRSSGDTELTQKVAVMSLKVSKTNTGFGKWFCWSTNRSNGWVMVWVLSALEWTYSNNTWASWHIKSRQLNYAFNSVPILKTKKTIKVLHCWPFVRGIHQLLVDSPHKGPVMEKACPYDDIMVNASYETNACLQCDMGQSGLHHIWSATTSNSNFGMMDSKFACYEHESYIL